MNEHKIDVARKKLPVYVVDTYFCSGKYVAAKLILQRIMWTNYVRVELTLMTVIDKG